MNLELDKLREDIKNYEKETNLDIENENDKVEVWFYPDVTNPQSEGYSELKNTEVKGFSGTQDIILLGLNPSSGTFPSFEDKLLYKLLREKGIENIHVSDFVKVRAKNKEVTKKLFDNEFLMKKQAEFFQREIEILKPKIIIPMGKKCKTLLKKYLPEIKKKYKIIGVLHYGNNHIGKKFYYKSKDEYFHKISQQLDKITEEYFNKN